MPFLLEAFLPAFKEEKRFLQAKRVFSVRKFTGMSNNKTVKGLLKGLRYISKVFDDEQEQPELQIGYPTDVKHVAHIGYDGPENTSGPTWMNDFKANPGDDSSPRSNDHNRGNTKETKDARKLSVAVPPKDDIPSPALSPSPQVTDGTKKHRSHRSTQNSSLGSPNKSATGGHRPSRRSKGSTDATSQDGVTKKVRRRRKVSSEGSSTTSTKSKEKNLSIDGEDSELAGAELVDETGHPVTR